MLDWLIMLKAIFNIQTSQVLFDRKYLIKVLSLFMKSNQFQHLITQSM